MIQEIRIKNFRSFKDEVVFSFEASKDSNFEDKNVIAMNDGTRLLRFAAVFGANASGKSNLLWVFEFLRRFWKHKPKDSDEKININSFMLDSETSQEPSQFHLKFYVGQTKYAYKLIVDSSAVYEEQLNVYTSVQPSSLFSRQLDENEKSVIKFNSSLKLNELTVQEIALRCLKNTSLFAVINTVNSSFGKLEEAKDKLSNYLMPMIGPTTHMLNFAEQRMVDNKELKDYLLWFIKKADFNISNINIEKSKEEIPERVKQMILSDSNVPEEAKKSLQNQNFLESLNTLFVHEVRNSRGVETYNLSEEQQSRGTQRVLGIETAIQASVKNQSFLAIDEMETSLNPMLLDFVIQNYLSEKSSGQLLITTHYDALLNRVDKYLRKDSVWFTEKMPDGSTKVYSLKDVRGINKMRNLQKRYEDGSLVDAYPHISKN